MGVISNVSSSNRLCYGTRCGRLIRNMTSHSWSSWERCKHTYSKRAGHSSAAVLGTVVWRGGPDTVSPIRWSLTACAEIILMQAFSLLTFKTQNQNEFCTRSESADAFFLYFILNFFFWLKHLSPNSDAGRVVVRTHAHIHTKHLWIHTSHFHTLTSWSHNFLENLDYYYIGKVWLCFWRHLWQSQTAPQGASAPRLQRGGLNPPTRTFYSEVILWNITVCLGKKKSFRYGMQDRRKLTRRNMKVVNSWEDKETQGHLKKKLKA